MVRECVRVDLRGGRADAFGLNPETWPLKPCPMALPVAAVYWSRHREEGAYDHR